MSMDFLQFSEAAAVLEDGCDLVLNFFENQGTVSHFDGAAPESCIVHIYLSPFFGKDTNSH